MVPPCQLATEEGRLDTVPVHINNFYHLPVSSLWTMGKTHTAEDQILKSSQEKLTQGVQ